MGACSDDEDGTTPVVGLDKVVTVPTTMTLTAGSRQSLSVAGVDGNNVTLTDVTFSYTSGSPAVAMVTSTGSVIGLSAGTSQITVTATRAGVTKTATVNVTVTGALANTATVESGAAANTFTPNFLVIARGGTVNWTFTGRTHNVTFAGATGAPANIPNTGNATAPVSRTFSTGGTFDYQCTLHAGMTGTVVVP